MTAGKGLNETRSIFTVPHGQRRHLQAHDPAFRAFFQRRHIGVGQTEVHHTVQKCGGFFGCKHQFGSTQFDQLIAPAPPRQRQRRIGAPGNHHMHLRRQMIDQKSDGFVNGGRLNDVVIVEDQDGGLCRRTDLIDQRGQQWFDPGRWRRMLVRPPNRG